MKMIVSSLLLFFPILASAQIINSIGVDLGLTRSNQTIKSGSTTLSGLNAYDYSSIGINVEYLKKTNYTIVSELSLNTKGTTWEVEKTSPTNPQRSELNAYTNTFFVLSFSTGLKLFYELDPIVPYIIISPRIDFLLNKNTDSNTTVFYEKTNTTVFGGTVNIGSEFKVFGVNLFADGMYDRDFSNFTKNKNTTITNYQFAFRFGGKFNF